MANYRIGENTLIRRNSTDISEKFWNNGIQFVHADYNSWDNAIWVADLKNSSGEVIKKLAHFRNKNYNNTGLLPIPNESDAKEYVSNLFEIMLKQGFKFSPDGIIGLHCIILNLDTKEVLVSQFLREDDFHITSNRLRIDGSFWMTKADIYIPKISGTLVAAITELTSEDIDSENGFIYNFVSPSEQLNDDKQIIESIKNKAEIDENFYLTVSLTTSELNKSVEQTFYDYINYNPSNVNVEHTINYGNSIIGTKSIKISNETNIFAPIKVGLDISNYTIKEYNRNVDSEIEIRVTSDIKYDANFISNETVLITKIKDTILPIISDIIKENIPDIIYPVNVNLENKIEQTVVETNIDRQVIQVLQPIFCEMVNNSFVIENKRLTFENFNQSGYLVISETKKTDEQILKNDVTVDGKYYFDLSKLITVDEDTTYTLYDENQKMILGKGIVYSKYPTEIESTDIP